MELASLISPERVLLGLHARDKADVLSALAYARRRRWG